MSLKIIATILTTLTLSSKPMNFDFGSQKSGKNWMVINDGVMGGLSRGGLQFSENSLQFSGNVSLANNGGFSSLKSPFGSFDLGDAQIVEIRYRSKGYAIALTLENYPQFYMPYYKLILKDTKGEWQTLKVDVKEFKAYRLGQAFDQSITPEKLASVIRIGFITSEKREGDFDMEVDYLKFK
ncbi:MAG: CIA30 family protein [Bacteroidia bacterium]|nr:CIA30 family protein [Bacteroidia bacterium]